MALILPFTLVVTGCSAQQLAQHCKIMPRSFTWRLKNFTIPILHIQYSLAVVQKLTLTQEGKPEVLHLKSVIKPKSANVSSSWGQKYLYLERSSSLPGKPIDVTPGKGRNRSRQPSSLEIPLAVPTRMHWTPWGVEGLEALCRVTWPVYGVNLFLGSDGRGTSLLQAPSPGQ